MISFESVKNNVNEIFSNELIVPEPPIHWKDKIEALEEADLDKQRAAAIYDMRKWQAAEMGFQEIDSADMVEMIMGQPHTLSEDGKNRQQYEWIYNHHLDTNDDDSGWGGKPTIFKRIEKVGLWHLPPFSKKVVWEVQFGKLNYLEREIPYGVILRINEIKKLKLFNCFNVMAPMEAWQKKTDIDPIVVASIWELPPSIEKKSTAGSVSHWFVAQW